MNPAFHSPGPRVLVLAPGCAAGERPKALVISPTSQSVSGLLLMLPATAIFYRLWQPVFHPAMPAGF